MLLIRLIEGCVAERVADRGGLGWLSRDKTEPATEQPADIDLVPKPSEDDGKDSSVVKNLLSPITAEEAQPSSPETPKEKKAREKGHAKRAKRRADQVEAARLQKVADNSRKKKAQQRGQVATGPVVEDVRARLSTNLVSLAVPTLARRPRRRLAQPAPRRLNSPRVRARLPLHHQPRHRPALERQAAQDYRPRRPQAGQTARQRRARQGRHRA